MKQMITDYICLELRTKNLELTDETQTKEEGA